MKNKKIFGLTIISLLLMISANKLLAQELKLDGYLNSGIGLIATNDDNDETVIRAHGVDSEQNGFRFRLNGSYTNAANNAGVRFRFQSQANFGANNVSINVVDGDDTIGTARYNNLFGYFSLPYVFGWVGFFENKVTLSGGIIEDNISTNCRSNGHSGKGGSNEKHYDFKFLFA